jgi:hypothetical protein
MNEEDAKLVHELCVEIRKIMPEEKKKESPREST